jgi:hypothetical protein
MATTTENIVFDTTINVGNSGNSIKSVRSELRQLNQELATLDPNSKQFVAAAKRAGELKDRIGDVRNAVDAFNPEGKFKAFAGAVGIAANGFSALQGAMAIFGSESEDLQKVMARTQGAIALATGLNGLLGMKDSFVLLKNQIIKDVIPSLFTLRTALIATGLGAVAVAIGVLYQNWDRVTSSLEKSFPAFKVVSDFFKNLRQIAAGTIDSIAVGFKELGSVFSSFAKADFSEAIETAKNIGTKMAAAYNEAYKEEDRKVKIDNGLKSRKENLELLEAQGKDTRSALIKLMQDELSILEKGSEAYRLKLIEIEKAKTVLRKEADDKQKEEDRKVKIDNGLKSRKENLELLEAQGKDTRSALIKLMQDELSILEKGSEAYRLKLIEIEKAKTVLRKEADDKQKEESRKKQEAKLNEAKSDYDFFQNLNKEKHKKEKEEEGEMIAAELASLMAAAETSVSITKKEAEAKKQITEAEVQHRLILNNSIAAGLNSIADIAGRNTAAGKALAVASATISTYTAIAGQLAAFAGVPIPGYAIVQAIATGVAGFAAVKNIIDTPVPGGAGSSGGGGGSLSFVAPPIPQIPQSVSGTRLNQTDPLRTINEGKDSKVFVTETDITKTQNKVKNIIKKATIK